MTHDPARILLRASCALRRRDINWGKEWFVDPGCGSRCSLGAIAWAAGDQVDGNPFFTEGGDKAAIAFAEWLVDTGRATRCVYPDGNTDYIETVGGWNDEGSRSVDEVWRALSECAAWLDERACRERHPAGKALIPDGAA